MRLCRLLTDNTLRVLTLAIMVMWIGCDELIADGSNSAEASMELDQIEVTIGTAESLRIIEPEATDIPLELTNHGSERQDFTVRLTVQGFDGSERVVEERFSLDAGEAGSVAIPNDAGLGHFEVVCDLYSGDVRDGRGDDRRNLSYVVMQPVGPQPKRERGMLYGLVSPVMRYDPDVQRQHARVAGVLGMDLLRTAFEWPRMERRDDPYEAKRQMIDIFAEQQVEIQPMLLGTPYWARADEDGHFVADMDDWRNHVRSLVDEFKDDITYIEIWNEPDVSFWLGTTEEYLEMQAAAYEEIKEVAPHIQVMNGGLVSMTRDREVARDVIVDGVDSYDLVGIHIHGFFNRFRDQIAMLHEMQDEYGLERKPIYFSETGAHSLQFGEAHKTETLVKKIIYSQAIGAEAYCWFNIVYPGRGRPDYGLFTDEWYPRPALVSYNTLMRYTGDKPDIQQAPSEEDTYIYLLSGDEAESTMVSWIEDGEGDERALHVRTDAEAVYEIDLMGNRRALPLTADGVVIRLGDSPVFHQFVGISELPEVAERPIVEVHAPFVSRRGQAATLQVDLFNPLDEVVDATVWVGDETQAASSSTQVSLAPHERSQVDLSMQVEDESIATVGFRLGEHGLEGRVDVPTRAARVLGSRPDGEPDFTLDHPSQVMNRFDHDPNTRHLTWQGPEDTSGAIWLDATDDALRVVFEVVDDTFVPATNGGGDHVRVILHFGSQDDMWVFRQGLDDQEQAVFRIQRSPSAADRAAEQISHNAVRTAEGMRYELEIPFTALGVDREELANGFRFNAEIYDDDYPDDHRNWQKLIYLADGMHNDPTSREFPAIAIPENR